MTPFLYQVARQILAENPGRTEQVLVVFNNHRSELFLRQQFKKISAEDGSTFFLPRTMVIDDLVAQLSGLEVVPNEFLLFELYRIHMELEGEERKYKTFEEFISFGDMMLGDFSEVDRYLVDARDLFQNLHGLKQIGEWNIDDPDLSQWQLDYLRFYRSLYDYYTLLRQRLAARGQAYAGMAYRAVAEEIVESEMWKAKSEKQGDSPLSTFHFPLSTYFVGFNAISECERAIIGEFVRRGCGHLLTDGDAYYYDDPRQEAGYFLRKHSAEFTELGHYGPSLFATTQKNITIVECPENVLQCKYAGQLLSEHPDWVGDAESTAIVLADESLLIPTLNGLPEVPDRDYRVNVTMGFAYADSQLHALVVKLLELYRRRTDRGYYHKDVVEVASDHYMSRLLKLESPRYQVTTLLEKGYRVRVHATDLEPLINGQTASLLLPPAALTPDECIAQIQRMVALLADEGGLTANPKERQAAGALMEVIEYLHRLQQEYHFIQSIDTLENIYNRIAQRHTIAFLGEPLSGLQILGMLETRNLDFRRVILLSAGEGVLPAARPTSTLIPHELKRAFNLPTYEERDSVYAYNFYRLLQRAEDIYLVYSSNIETAGKGEESRLLKQVRSELARRFPQTVHVTDLVVDTGGGLHQPDAESAAIGHKTEAVMQTLYRISEKSGFTPTALGRYVECPLKYYYMSIMGLREQDTVEDDIDASQLGEAVHNVLRDIYQPMVGSQVDPAVLNGALANIEQLLDKEMEKLMSGGRDIEGRNMFLRSVALTQLSRVLAREAAIASQHRLEIVAVEQDYTYTLWHQEGHAVQIGGRVDRIDRLDGQLRVIDYKTGSFKGEEIAYKSTPNKKGVVVVPNKWLQLMCYALMYRRRFPADESLRVGIYPLRHLQSDVRLASWNGQEELTTSLLDSFEQQLGDLLHELLNADEPFLPNTINNACRYCPAKDFCRAKQAK